jgi:hypothetical protein
LVFDPPSLLNNPPSLLPPCSWERESEREREKLGRGDHIYGIRWAEREREREVLLTIKK